jgi:LmbE family N-acetylglucosaminyl deacetylase
MGQNLRFLGIVAHPHDFTHYAGTLGVHTSLGDTATIVSMTAGVGTHNEKLATELMKPLEQQDPAIIDQPAEERAAEKADELRRACAIFGVTDVRVLDYPDKPFVFERHPDSAESLREIILDVRPHVIIAQSPYLDGPHGHKSGVQNDHTETANATEMAKLLASLPRLGSGQAPHTVAATYFPGVYFSREAWDFAIDVSDWYEQRIEAEATYVSQGHTPEYARRRITLGLGSTGSSVGTMYAEAFVREKAELLSQVTLPDSLMKLETQTRIEQIAAITGEGESDAP